MFSFSARKQYVEIAPYLRKICDCTAPNSGRTEQLDRAENRYNRSLPVLIWPWRNDRVDSPDCVTAITKDITEHGMGLLLNAPPVHRDVVVCLLSNGGEEPQPWFFLGQVARSEDIGAGYWLVGLELTLLLNRDRPECVEELYPQAYRLLPCYAGAR